MACLVGTSVGSFAAAASAAADAGVGSGAALESLLAHIPAGHRDYCRGDMSNEDAEAIMSVRCELPSGITVHYSQLVSTGAADARYLKRLETKELEQDDGDCSVAVPAEQPYTVGGEPAGRLLCEDSSGYDTFEWTHDATGIYSLAIVKEDLPGLWEWWSTESGPLSTPDETLVTGIGAALDSLVSHAPESFRSTCLPFDGGDPEDGVAVSIKCEPADDMSVYYDHMASAESLAQQYQDEVDQEDIGSEVGDCSESLPGEQPYYVGGELAGRLLCTEFFDNNWFTWTHLPTLILATASADRSLADMWTRWLNESGPVS